MSDSVQSQTVLDMEAAAWLERIEFGTVDSTALEAWLEQSFEHRVAYWRIKSVWLETDRFAALRNPARPNTPKAVAPRLHLGWPLFLRSAAAAAVVLAAVGAAAIFSDDRSQTFATEVGARKTLTLADGSQIELNTDTSLRLSPDKRTVWLEKGEAYFQITHDETRPFSVNVGDHRVIDLGTKFVIRHDSRNTRVSLIEGRAEVRGDDAATQAKPVVLTPGDVAVASSGVISVERRPSRELSAELGWRRGLLIFYHTSLAEAAVEFNRYNSTKLIIADDGVAQRRINGTFLANNVEVFGNVAKAALGLHVRNEENRIVISQ